MSSRGWVSILLPDGRILRGDRPRRTLLAIALIAATLSACGTDPIDLGSIRVQGRAYDGDSGLGLEAVTVMITWGAGASGNGSSNPVYTDPSGHYLLVVEFDSPIVCERGAFDLGIVIPDGHMPDRDDFQPLECVETVQYRDLRMRPAGGQE